ncbi:MAG: hypothetical protein ACRD6I_13565 [Candidatus Acidiferrales bacterium]
MRVGAAGHIREGDALIGKEGQQNRFIRRLGGSRRGSAAGQDHFCAVMRLEGAALECMRRNFFAIEAPVGEDKYLKAGLAARARIGNGKQRQHGAV